jgi:hypothetical protein
MWCVSASQRKQFQASSLTMMGKNLIQLLCAFFKYSDEKLNINHTCRPDSQQTGITARDTPPTAKQSSL